MLQFQDLSVELEHAVLRNSSLHNRFQIEQSEDEEKHNENINNMAIMLKNYTDMFNQNIGKLEVGVSDLTKMYKNQVKIQSDIQQLIETYNRNIRTNIVKLDTKYIEVQKQINEIVRTQNVIQKKLSDIVLAGSNEHISKQKRNNSEWISYTSGIHTLLLSMFLFIIICM
ncbi:uncharacterized protein LOC134719506 [Mytilus trossulus]|uniref:uncharacterized protein LOC134719506 n=1 Tax=Mytilus trossulus TaxID=6551 RepID=UPI003005C4DD